MTSSAPRGYNQENSSTTSAKNRLIQQKLIGNTVRQTPPDPICSRDPASGKHENCCRSDDGLSPQPHRSNNLVTFIVRAYLVHTGGFGIEDNLSCNCSAHIGHLCQQTCVLLSISITGSLPEMLKQVEIFTDGSCPGIQYRRWLWRYLYAIAVMKKRLVKVTC